MSSEPDITTADLDGTEDFVIVACDGLWDTVSPEEATDIVFDSVKTGPKKPATEEEAKEQSGEGRDLEIYYITMLI